MYAKLKEDIGKGIENQNEYKHAEMAVRKMLRQTKGTFMEQDALHDLARFDDIMPYTFIISNKLILVALFIYKVELKKLLQH